MRSASRQLPRNAWAGVAGAQDFLAEVQWAESVQGGQPATRGREKRCVGDELGEPGSLDASWLTSTVCERTAPWNVSSGRGEVLGWSCLDTAAARQLRMSQGCSFTGMGSAGLGEATEDLQEDAGSTQVCLCPDLGAREEHTQSLCSHSARKPPTETPSGLHLAQAHAC